MRFEDILDNYLIDPPADSEDGQPQPLSSLVPQRDVPSFEISSNDGEPLDCTRVYEAAEIPLNAPLPVEKALELIERLPEDIPMTNRRVVVRMTLETMGATTRDVLTDAAGKIWALDAYFKAACEDVAAATRDVDERIRELRAQIDDLMKAKHKYEAQRAEIEASADSTIDGIRTVVDFFATAAGEAAAAEQTSPQSAPQPEPEEPEEPAAATAIRVDQPPSPEPKAAEPSHYDPIRRPVAEGDDLELPDLGESGDRPTGFWEASSPFKEPESAEEMESTFYTETGEIRRPDQGAA